jgi:hypothetical protein
MRTIHKIIIFSAIMLAIPAAFLLSPTHMIEAKDEIMWGVNFSASQAEYLELDPRETYTAIIEELGAKRIKLHINWNAIETIQDEYDFEELDWQVAQAEANEVKLILVVGMKTGRWPECHTPTWFYDVAPADRQNEIVSYVETIASRYHTSTAIEYWQVENEPFLDFGTCPNWYYDQDTSLVEAEIAAIKAIDPKRKIIVTESGELSTWRTAASVADIVGITTYRSSWNTAEETFGLNPYTFLSPQFYATKAAFIKNVYRKPVINVELQAEPWTSVHLKEATLEEQALSMNPELFTENVEFARQTGIGTFYFWGAEWWYWMKLEHNDPTIWNQATLLLSGS